MRAAVSWSRLSSEIARSSSAIVFGRGCASSFRIARSCSRDRATPGDGAPGRPSSEISSALAPNEPDPGTPAEPPAGSHPRVRAGSRSASTDDQGLPALGPPTRHTQPPFLRFFRLGPLRAAHSDPLPQAEARPAEISPSLPSSPLHAPPRVGRRLTRIAVGSGGSISVVFVLPYDRFPWVAQFGRDNFVHLRRLSGTFPSCAERRSGAGRLLVT